MNTDPTAEERALEHARKIWPAPTFGYDEAAADAAMRKTFVYHRLLLGEHVRDLGTALQRTAPWRLFVSFLERLNERER